MQKAHAGLDFDITIESIEPQRLFSFRWHPFAIDKNVDYSLEPTTLVSFTLQETSGGVLLTVMESGFDAIPLARRAAAFGANDGGWAIMVKVLGEYVDQPA